MHSMSNNILFVFEGEKTENQIVTNLQKVFFESENTIITCVYGGEIYQIYDEISKDEDLDTFNLIKGRTQNIDLLKDYNRNDFAEIYMFFDYDGQSRIADDNKLKELLDFFNEETDKGKLYISYPMVESLKHIICHKSFKDLKVRCKEKIDYKELVSKECLKDLQNFTIYKIDTWKLLIDTHLKKMSYIVCDLFKFPHEIIIQSTIFSKQIEKYISQNPSVIAILSAFPVFLHDYYGNSKTKEMIS